MVFVAIVLACLFFVLVGLAVGLLVGGMAKVSDDPLYDEALADWNRLSCWRWQTSRFKSAAG